MSRANLWNPAPGNHAGTYFTNTADTIKEVSRFKSLRNVTFTDRNRIYQKTSRLYGHVEPTHDLVTYFDKVILGICDIDPIRDLDNYAYNSADIQTGKMSDGQYDDPERNCTERITL